MKKLTAIALVLCLVFSVAACTAKPASTPTPAPATDKPAPAEPTVEPAAGTQEEPKGEKVLMRIAGTCTASDEVGEYLGMKKLEELIELYSEGTIDVEIYPANQLGGASELAQSIQLGTVEGAVLGLDVFSTFNPICYITSLPYVFDNYDVVRDTLDGKNSVGQKLYDSMRENNDVRIIGGMHRGYRAIGLKARASGAADDAVITPADFAGLTIRTPDTQTVSQVVESFGARSVIISTSEIATSLAQGLIDGIDYGFTELWAHEWDGVKYVVETNHATSDVCSLVNETWFQTLTEAQQEAILRAGQEAADYRYEIMLSETEKGREKLAGWGVIDYHDDMIDMDAFRACAEPLYKEWIGKYIDQELYDEIMALNEAAN